MNWTGANERIGRVRRLALSFSVAAVLSGLGAGLVAPTASALRGLNTGFANSPVLTSPFTPEATRVLWLGKAAGDGATFVRVPFQWQQIAPSTRPTGFDPSNPASPGYNWSSLDPLVKDIVSRGLQPVLLPYLAPVWAQDGTPPSNVRPGAWMPDPTQFADFGHALATRYSGTYPDPANPGQFLPRVTYYQAWNEPNFSYDISPIYKKTVANPPLCTKGKQTCPGWTPVSPGIYRGLLNAFYSAVKGVNQSDFVLSGGLAPDGDAGPVGSKPNLWRVRPLTFLRSLFCLNQALKKVCSATVHFDAVDTHPYVFGPPTTPPVFSDDLGTANMYKVDQILIAAQRAGTVPAGKKQVWAGEISFASNPPLQTKYGFPPARQAAFLEQSLYLLWQQHASTVLWLDMRDLPPSNSKNPFNYGGLYFNSGAPKLAVTAFWFPFVTKRLDSKHVQAWGRAPVAGKVRIERKVGGTWHVLARLTVATHQVFEKTVKASGPGKFRAQIGHDTSLPWSQSG